MQRDARTRAYLVAPRPDALYELDADRVLDLSLLDLARIQTDGGKVTIGALTPLQEIAVSPEIESLTHGLLSKAAHQSATLGIRNLASLGGALLKREGPPEIKLALLVLGAEVLLRSEAETPVALNDFLQLESLETGSLPVEVRFEGLSAIGQGVALERVGRTPRDMAIVAAAAVVEARGEQLGRVRLAVSATNGYHERITAAESVLENQAISVEALEKAAQTVTDQVQVVGDYRGSEEYRRAMAGALARRAVQHAWQQAAGKQADQK